MDRRRMMATLVTTTTLLVLTASAVMGGGTGAGVGITTGTAVQVHEDVASFYGDSHIRLGLQEAKSTTQIQFRFRTRRPDALLLLAAGRTDYCLVLLSAAALKVHINLGAGETEVASPKGLRLDDLLWHEVNITRVDADFTLLIDGVHTTRAKLPGRFHELNIQYGVMVGGLGDFSELFLGILESFRGCLASLRYNSVAVLERARRGAPAASGGSSKGVSAVAVTWDCAAEFELPADATVSFWPRRPFSDNNEADDVADDAGDALLQLAVSVPRANVALALALRLHPDARDGMVLYASGASSRPDFFALEMIGGRLRLVVDKGGGVWELRHNGSSVADGSWHLVTALVAPTYLELGVDGEASASRPATPGVAASKFLDLADGLFVGGLDASRRPRAASQGLKAAQKSLRGCMRGLQLDGRLLGLPHARLTKGIRPGCFLDGDTDADHGSTDSSLSSQSELVATTPVRVSEGGVTTLTTQHLRLLLDRDKFGVRESGVLFRVLRPFQHGRLQLDGASSSSGASSSRLMFTLLDVASGRLRYVHDGSETLHDAATLETELAPGIGFILPDYLQGKGRDGRRFRLEVEVTPVNDAPELRLGGDKVLRLASGTRRRLTPEILWAEDPDSPQDSLVFSVVALEGSGGVGGVGTSYVENAREPGRAVTSFSAQEVEEALIWFVHGGRSSAPSLRLAVRVSDGVQSGAAGVLRVETFPLQLQMANNTGLTLQPFSSALMTTANLSFTSNAVVATDAADAAHLPAPDIRYDVTRPPDCGQVERRRDDGSWTPVTQFWQRQLRDESLRYTHTGGACDADADSLKFQVSVLGARHPSTFDFRFRLVQVSLSALRDQVLRLRAQLRGVVTETSLLYQTAPFASPHREVVYKILRLPRYGLLEMALEETTPPTRKLDTGATFSQQDVLDGRLRYRLLQTAYSSIQDSFQFQVTSANGSAGPSEYRIDYEPGEDLASRLKSPPTPLDVEEGGRATLGDKHLGLLEASVPLLIINITTPPKHGRIDILDPTLTEVKRRDATEFTSAELDADRVVYLHDDSEDHRDNITFLALASTDADGGFMYVGTVEVLVRGVNDQPPRRTGDAPLEVRRGGHRRLSPTVLRFEDADSPSGAPDAIIITHRGVPHGNIMRRDATDAQPVFQFTQADVDAGLLDFRHIPGDDDEPVDDIQMAIWASDGVHVVTDELTVHVALPWVRIEGSRLIKVRRGSWASIGVGNLSAVTNADDADDALAFTVTQPPRHGALLIDSLPAHSFTQTDLLAQRLVYRHHDDDSDASGLGTDSFHFRLSDTGAPDATAHSRMDIRIFPASYWEPLQVTANATLEVAEGGYVIIDAGVLSVAHPHVPPTDVVYEVIQGPHFGRLELESESSPAPSASPASQRKFDQDTLNSGLLRYIQTEPDVAGDWFSFRVGNGVVMLESRRLVLVVIPKVLALSTTDLSVLEGAVTSVTLKHLHVATPYYADRVEEFRVTRAPRRGRLQLATSPGRSVRKFAAKQLSEGRVQYVHDGSEDAEDDSFWVVAHAGDKASAATQVNIHVIPVNDCPPALLNLSTVDLWEGAAAVVTSKHLSVVDEDTPSQNITYMVMDSKGGHFVRGPFTDEEGHSPLTSFTQADVDAGHVLFLHTEGTSVSAHLTATDGVQTLQSIPMEFRVQEVTLTVTSPQTLRVFPLTRTTLTPSHLLAITSDGDASRRVTFILRHRPRLGRLLVRQEGDDDRDAWDAGGFSQRDVNDSRVAYEHTAPLTSLSGEDVLELEAATPWAPPVKGVRVEVHVTLSAAGDSGDAGLAHLMQVTPLTVEEGASATLTNKNLDLSELEGFLASRGLRLRLSVRLGSTPVHGDLILDGRRLKDGAEVPLSALAASKIQYRHDDSDTSRDSVELSLWLSPPPDAASSTEVSLMNATLPIHIKPVNDQPFRLVTLHPQMEVVQGHWRTITETELLAEDADSTPEQLVYDVVSGPTLGRLILVREGTPGAVRGQPALRFTQADIALGRVRYQHDGPVAGANFHFRVWDGRFPPSYAVFSVDVIPATLSTPNNAAVSLKLPQGSASVPMTPDMLPVATNGDPGRVAFNVTVTPRYGHILLNDTASTSFSAADVRRRAVNYVQRNMTASNDTFKVVAWIRGVQGVTLPPRRVDVTVIPLLRPAPPGTPPFAPKRGRRTQLPLSALDATPLAQLTRTNPVFEVVEKPKFGRLRKLVPSRHVRAAPDAPDAPPLPPREKEAARFTLAELRNGMVVYVARDVREAHDSFTYRLTAPGVQPAYGRLQFALLPPDGDVETPPTLPTLPTTIVAVVPTAATPPTRAVSSPNLSGDSALIAGVVIGVVALAAAIVLLVKCNARRRRRGEATKDIDKVPPPSQPEKGTKVLRPPLPPPTLTSLAPPDQLQAPPSVPHCRVTPLDAPDVALPPSDPSPFPPAPFPYGSDNAMDAPDAATFAARTNNPLLRKNQYWV